MTAPDRDPLTVIDMRSTDPWPYNPSALCACGHEWRWHDVEEYRGDGSEMCCASGCEQIGCPGRG